MHNRAHGDDLLGDAYEYLMRHLATQSGKGQFYTPAEVARIMAQVIGIGPDTRQDHTIRVRPGRLTKELPRTESWTTSGRIPN